MHKNCETRVGVSSLGRIGPELDGARNDIILLEQHTLEVLVPVCVLDLSRGDEVDKQFVAVGEVCEVDEFAKWDKRYPPYF